MGYETHTLASAIRDNFDVYDVNMHRNDSSNGGGSFRGRAQHRCEVVVEHAGTTFLLATRVLICAYVEAFETMGISW